MPTTFLALNIPVLNFSNEPDRSGSIIPPEAHVTYPKVIPVTYGEDDKPIGLANLRRSGDRLLADMTLHVTMKDSKNALRLLQKLFPATAFNVTAAHKNIILGLHVVEVFLTPHGNHDATIMSLGESVHIRPKGSH